MRILGALGLATVALLPLDAAIAQAPYPSRPVRMVVPFAPGGGVDVVARIIGPKLSEGLGQPVVIDNKPGANTGIAAENIARSAPDGHSLLLTIDFTMTVNPTIYSRLAYNADKDFAPVSMVTEQMNLIVTSPKIPPRTFPEFLAYLKANPGKVNYASGAVTAQLVGELIMSMSGTKMVFVPYKGSAPALAALLAGDIQMSVGEIPTFGPPAKEGRLVALAVTGKVRDTALPDVPTISENGLPGFEVRNWIALFAPASTSPAVIGRINSELVKFMSRPETKAQFSTMGRNAVTTTPDELSALVRSDTTRWANVIRSAGLKFEQ